MYVHLLVWFSDGIVHKMLNIYCFLVVNFYLAAVDANHLEFLATYEENVQRSTIDDSVFKNDLNSILKERRVGTRSHEAVKQFIMDTLSGLDWHVYEDEFSSTTPIGDKTFKNVIATHNTEADYRLVFACHYDSKMFEFQFVGATDSAVPCAMLINLARKLNDKLEENKNSDLTLQLIFFDGEEAFSRWTVSDSTYGSKHIAKKWADTPWVSSKGENMTEINRIKLLVLLDLLGTARPRIPRYFQNTKDDFHRLMNIQQTLNPQESYFFDQSSYPISDDHLPFLSRDVPILHVIPSPFPSVWHTENDNKAALDFTTIDNFNRIFLQFVSEYMQL